MFNILKKTVFPKKYSDLRKSDFLFKNYKKQKQTWKYFT